MRAGFEMDARVIEQVFGYARVPGSMPLEWELPGDADRILPRNSYGAANLPRFSTEAEAAAIVIEQMQTSDTAWDPSAVTVWTRFREALSRRPEYSPGSLLSGLTPENVCRLALWATSPSAQ